MGSGLRVSSFGLRVAVLEFKVSPWMSTSLVGVLEIRSCSAQPHECLWVPTEAAPSSFCAAGVEQKAELPLLRILRDDEDWKQKDTGTP